MSLQEAVEVSLGQMKAQYYWKVSAHGSNVSIGRRRW